ncbi:hypothetical protein Hypma_004178 [Hypsizygus marmoreus]|uniref:Uncharacterized protein n=1 Tax=Hypsizygus marmoreus TaxID=39966 RepID=A0A369J4U7_HYPMA|nr:hypothetical protein Hypma_004178 [Hypsizygus marmoreus]
MADPISTVRSLCTLAISLLTWLEETQEKEDTLSSISSTLSRICSILVPFQNATRLEPALVDALLGLGDILHRTREHLVLWGSNRGKNGRRNSLRGAVGFFVPAQVTKVLNQDEQQLSQQLIIILFSMATISFFRDRYPIPAQNADRFALRSAKNQEIFNFWRDYVGAKVLYARGERFSEALGLCFGDWLSDAVRERLTYRLDEYRVGGVAISSLERFVGDGSLKQAIEEFKTFDSHPAAIEPHLYEGLPMVVWVDDNPANNAEEVAFARNKGIQVVEFTSTALAKAWIEANEDFLRKNDSPSNIRFISDTARFETDHTAGPGASLKFNITAGENILRYLRGHLYRAPVLIFCGGGIVHTEYVKSYESAGSTCHSAVVLSYIAALANRQKNDDRWQGFNVVTAEVALSV